MCTLCSFSLLNKKRLQLCFLLSSFLEIMSMKNCFRLFCGSPSIGLLTKLRCCFCLNLAPPRGYVWPTNPLGDEALACGHASTPALPDPDRTFGLNSITLGGEAMACGSAFYYCFRLTFPNSYSIHRPGANVASLLLDQQHAESGPLLLAGSRRVGQIMATVHMA